MTTEICQAVLIDHPELPCLRVNFRPGATGHESYYFDHDFIERTCAMPPRVKSETRLSFGQDGMVSARWHLCAGSPVYDTLWLNVSSMQGMVRTFAAEVERQQLGHRLEPPRPEPSS